MMVEENERLLVCQRGALSYYFGGLAVLFQFQGWGRALGRVGAWARLGPGLNRGVVASCPSLQKDLP
jgi:hypothetical protein